MDLQVKLFFYIGFLKETHTPKDVQCTSKAIFELNIIIILLRDIVERNSQGVCTGRKQWKLGGQPIPPSLTPNLICPRPSQVGFFCHNKNTSCNVSHPSGPVSLQYPMLMK